mmetsp:Transcript_23694/g.51801  ORF Transcript_23694/g.51801 Transcript_23694/m.51801 type:complete len:227 (+) Transcript_23694:1306-1986(+)
MSYTIPFTPSTSKLWQRSSKAVRFVQVTSQVQGSVELTQGRHPDLSLCRPYSVSLPNRAMKALRNFRQESGCICIAGLRQRPVCTAPGPVSPDRLQLRAPSTRSTVYPLACSSSGMPWIVAPVLFTLIKCWTLTTNKVVLPGLSTICVFMPLASTLFRAFSIVSSNFGRCKPLPVAISFSRSKFPHCMTSDIFCSCFETLPSQLELVNSAVMRCPRRRSSSTVFPW